MAKFVNEKWQADFDDDFSCQKPNEVTREALKEAERLSADPRTRYFSNVEEALAELNKD